MKKYSSLRKGFTLVELMIVIAIIGILAGVLYPSVSGYINGARDGSRTKALANIALSLGTYQAENGNYPQLKTSEPTKGCVSDLKEVLWTHVKNLNTENTPDFGVDDNGGINCKKKGGFAYKLLGTTSTMPADGAAYVLAARLENPKWATMKAVQFANITHTEGSPTNPDRNDYFKVIEVNKKDNTLKYGINENLPYYTVAN